MGWGRDRKSSAGSARVISALSVGFCALIGVNGFSVGIFVYVGSLVKVRGVGFGCPLSFFFCSFFVGKKRLWCCFVGPWSL